MACFRRREGGENTPALANVSLGASVSESQWAAIEPDVLLPVEEVWPITAHPTTTTEDLAVQSSAALEEPSLPSRLDQPGGLIVDG
jgi:hypothetical protein